jgi:thioredoxin-like negative regulator of GroEL
MLFYTDVKSDRIKHTSDELLHMYESVSDEPVYKDADVTFLRVDAEGKNGDELVSHYGISQVPTVILFNRGRQVMDAQGLPALLIGTITKDNLQDFIRQYFKERIEGVIEKQKEARLVRLEEANDESKPYFDSPAMLGRAENTYWERPLSYPGYEVKK